MKVLSKMKKRRFTLLLLALLAGCDNGSSEQPKSAANEVSRPVDVANVVEIIQTRCTSCHAESPTDDMFKVAPNGVFLETIEQMQQYAPRIHVRAVATKTMPFMNKTQMTEQERALIDQWVRAGAPAH